MAGWLQDMDRVKGDISLPQKYKALRTKLTLEAQTTSLYSLFKFLKRKETRKNLTNSQKESARLIQFFVLGCHLFK